MNFLAHLYFSGQNDDIRIGGFIADFIKGNDFHNFSPQIKSGILLHRKIDAFTDSHKLVEKSKTRLRKKYKKYAGVVVDIFYDHFLATNWDSYSKQTLPSFAREIYVLMALNYFSLPAKAKRMVPFMILGNWLESYKKIEMIELVLQRMPNRTSLPSEAKFGIEILNEHYISFNQEFNEFYGDLITFLNRKNEHQKLVS